MADSFFTELKRRNVFKVGTAYLILGWVVLQVADLIVPRLALPEWTITFLLVIGFLGFPFAIFFAWAFEITPDGVKRESDISSEESISAHTGRKLDFVIIGLLVVALGYFVYESRFESISDNPNMSENNSITEPAKPEGSSIAVLPFVNMSADPEQEYFSDGISEEILNVLAKLPHLKVTSRSSSFYYKGKDIKIKNVAKELNVKNVLEGSVRKFGNRIRITAQLIEAESDTHLWSETYDREIADLFAIQDEISKSIVEALKSKLGLDVNVVIKDKSNIDFEAHNEYLKGRFYVNRRTLEDLKVALSHFEKAIEIAPDYAEAWMGKAWAIKFSDELNYGDIPVEIALKRARAAIEKSLLLDADSFESIAILGLIQLGEGNKQPAIESFKKAIQINPNYADAYTWYGESQYENPLKQLELREKAFQLNPISMIANFNYAESLISFGRYTETEQILQHMQGIDPSHVQTNVTESLVNFLKGDVAESMILNDTFTKKYDSIVPQFNNALYKVDIGLNQQAGDVLTNTVLQHYKYLYSNNLEYFISEARSNLPRSEDDKLGAYHRGIAELIVENYAEAVKYLKKSDCKKCDYLIYSLKMVGDEDSAHALLDNRKALNEKFHNEHYGYWFDKTKSRDVFINTDDMNLAYLEDDVERAMGYLRKTIESGGVIEYELREYPMYGKLRSHPDWLNLKTKSDEHAKQIREQYLKLVEVDKNSIK